MEMIEEISLFLGLIVSVLFLFEYRRSERAEENEELLDQLLTAASKA